VAISNHMEILRQIWRRAGGAASGMSFPDDITLTRRAKRAIEMGRVWETERGYGVAEHLGSFTFDPTADPRKYRDIYNAVMTAQFGRNRSSAWLSRLIPSPVPVHTRPVGTAFQGHATSIHAQAIESSTSSDMVGTLRKMGWIGPGGEVTDRFSAIFNEYDKITRRIADIGETRDFRLTRAYGDEIRRELLSLQGSQTAAAVKARDVLNDFTQRFFQQDIEMMPGGITDQLAKMANIVERDIFGRMESITSQMLDLDMKIRANEMRLRTDHSLSPLERERLHDEIRMWRGDPSRPYTGRSATGRQRVTNLTDLRLRRRAIMTEAEEAQYLMDKIYPTSPARAADPVTGLAFKSTAYERALERMVENIPGFDASLERIELIEGQVRESFRSERMRMRNLSSIHDVSEANRGIFRGMPVSADYVRREDFFYDGGRWRELTEWEKSGEEAIVDVDGNIWTKEQLMARGKIRAGTAIRLTPQGGVDLSGMRLGTAAAEPIEENVRRVDFLRRMDKSLRRTTSTRRGDALTDAFGVLSEEVTRKMNVAFGVSDPWFAPQIFDDPVVGDRAMKLYRRVLGNDPMRSENIAKNLFLQLLYSHPNSKERMDAEKALKMLASRSKTDPISKRAWEILQDQVPELNREVLPSMQRLTSYLGETADELRIPRSARLFEAEVSGMATSAQRLEQMRLRTEIVRDTMDMSRWTAQELEVLNPPNMGPQWNTERLMGVTDEELAAMRDQDIRARQAFRERRAADEALGKRRKYMGHTGQEMSPERRSEYQRVFKRKRLLNGLIQEDLAELTAMFEEAADERQFVRMAHEYSRDPSELEDLYRFFDAEQESFARAQRVFAAKHTDIGSNLVEGIIGALTGDENIAQSISGRYLNPLEGKRDQVLARLFQMADEGGFITATNAEGATQRLKVHLLQQFDDDYFELTMLDEMGTPQMYGMRWQQHQLAEFAGGDDEIRSAIEARVRNYYDAQLSRMEIGSDEANAMRKEMQLELKRALRQRARFGGSDAIDRVSDLIGTRGSFVFEEVRQFMLSDVDRYYARVGTSADPVKGGLPVGDLVLRHMNLARSGFGVRTSIPQFMSNSLFELDRNGVPRLSRAFAPLVTGEGDAVFRLDEISDEARAALDDAVGVIRENLRAQNIELEDVIRLSEQMSAADDITSPVVRRLLQEQAGEFGFRGGRRVAPILGAGQTLEMPFDFYRQGVLEGLPEGAELSALNRNLMPTLGEAFAEALMYRRGSVDGLAVTADMDTSQRLLKGVSDAIAKQWGILTSEEVLQESPQLMEMVRPEFGPGNMLPPTTFLGEEAAEEAAPKVKRAAVRDAMEFFGGTKTMRAATIGGAAFLAWGMVTSSKRKKDHSGEQIPHLPGGSPYETPNRPGIAPYIQSANMGGQGGQLYYINARGSFDPAQLQSQVQGITGGSMATQIHSRPDPLRSERPTIEQRLS
jgi:hypothetical protein